MGKRALQWTVMVPGAWLLALSVVAQTPPPAKKLYCWDQNGQRVCSDALPPEAVSRAREEINAKSGMRTAEVGRELSEQERIQAEADHAQLQLDLAAQETRRRTEQAMLLSYRTEEELRRVFNERVTIVDNNIKTARFNVASLREGLVTLLQVAGDRELAGQPVMAATNESILQRHADLVRQRALQTSFERQRVELDQEIADIMQRYREMKGLAPVAAAGDAAGAASTADPSSTPAPIKQ